MKARIQIGRFSTHWALRPIVRLWCHWCAAILLAGCSTNHNVQPPLFDVLDSSTTGIGFINRLTPTPMFNMFNYMYFYNGSGVGAGDFNGDGFVDLFFAANQGQNKIYLNTGKLHFRDVTAAAKIPHDSAWSTGVSVVDINNDGLLDIYVCRVGDYEVLKSKNQLLICRGIDSAGIPFYEDMAAAYGVDFSGFSTQAGFFDYDGDGDLDMYLMNHSLRFDGTFKDRPAYANMYDQRAGDKLYRNDGNHFTDVTRTCGINSSIIGYGLGLAIADINLDGYPDLYVGNDFHENDYLYINNHDGTFTDTLTASMMHTSQFSMGVDVADITNDGFPEIVSVDMLPADPYILKRSLGGDEYNLFNNKLKSGYFPQYSRNNLQYNRRNGMFSEIGRYSGMEATDWSWAPLFVDFNNDGRKDLFISNGIPKRLNDMDYVNFVSGGDMLEKIHTNTISETDMSLIQKFPEIKLPNKFYINSGNAKFIDGAGLIRHAKATFSNGAAYADLDNDGDLDIIVNNIDDGALVYENTTNDDHTKKFIDIRLHGSAGNTNAIGSKVVVFTHDSVQLYEKFPVHGFQSSMEIPLHIGLDSVQMDSLVLIWPDNTYQRLPPTGKSRIDVRYIAGRPKFDYSLFHRHFVNTTRPVKDITGETQILYRHEENPFVEFDREPLIPHMVSREGPALAVADINGDGLEDVFIGSSKRNKSAVFMQQGAGRFARAAEADIDADSVYEDVDATWADVNGDHRPDLIVASGGNEYYGRDAHLQPRIYVNDSNGVLKRLNDPFPGIYLTASCVVAVDFSGDGKEDLFIGGRAVPWEYGEVPRSYLLQNDGTGKFRDVTGDRAPELSQVGFVTDAVWIDLDRDGDSDLVVSLEWGGICAFINDKGHFNKRMLAEQKGWWNFILPCDIDGDGDMDFIAGNLGLNSRLRASPSEPVKLYYNDFDGNGKKEQIVTYFLSGREIPFATKDELQKQIPSLKKRFLYAKDFAAAKLDDLFPGDVLEKASVHSADYFSNSILINNGNLSFSVEALPWEAQLSPFKRAVIVDANNDHLPDVLLVGNFYDNNVQMGRYDADFGTLLINKGHAHFECSELNGVVIKGQARQIDSIHVAGKLAYIIARNNDSVKVIRFDK